MASSDIFAAAQLLQVEAKGANVWNNGAQNAADDLVKIASEVRKGKITSEKVLNERFAQAAQQIAQFHQASAKQHWDQKIVKEAGHDLDAATMATERALEWSGHKIAGGTLGILRGARDVSGKLIRGTGFVTAEVGKTIDSLGTEVDDLGKRMSGNKVAE